MSSTPPNGNPIIVGRARSVDDTKRARAPGRPTRSKSEPPAQSSRRNKNPWSNTPVIGHSQATRSPSNLSPYMSSTMSTNDNVQRRMELIDSGRTGDVTPTRPTPAWPENLWEGYYVTPVRNLNLKQPDSKALSPATSGRYLNALYRGCRCSGNNCSCHGKQPEVTYR